MCQHLPFMRCAVPCPDPRRGELAARPRFRFGDNLLAYGTDAGDCLGCRRRSCVAAVAAASSRPAQTRLTTVGDAEHHFSLLHFPCLRSRSYFSFKTLTLAGLRSARVAGGAFDQEHAARYSPAALRWLRKMVRSRHVSDRSCCRNATLALCDCSNFGAKVPPDAGRGICLARRSSSYLAPRIQPVECRRARACRSHFQARMGAVLSFHFGRTWRNDNGRSYIFADRPSTTRRCMSLIGCCVLPVENDQQ
jgi:hypothetical protein